MKSIGVKESVIPYNLWHNPLDNVMEKYNGRIIQATDIMFEKGIDGDPALAEIYFENWMKRHDEKHGNCFHFIDPKYPEIIKITITRVGEDKSNRRMHEINNKKWKVRK